ncbi:MAG: alpha-glucosidase [Bacteroidetes bacterium]|nr:MAG: alpha-glucosidase [Bacteroidota bacterium]
MQKTWWKESVIYQIYPRSFCDSNGDGIGDIQGIISKLDHLQELGVNIVWLSPIYASPNDDNGYDISDYYGIMQEFGTIEDFDQMLAEMKKRNLKLMMDLVVNHSSDEHQWFQESRKSKDNPYRDFYFWRKGENGNSPSNWRSFFSGSAWQYDPTTEEYYLHLFTKKQPDLNWENEKLRQEIYKMMRFWLDKGISGFRMDVIPFISKHLDFPPAYLDNFDKTMKEIYANGPRIHEFLQEMNREVLSKYDITTVGEGAGISVHQGIEYVSSDKKELHTIFHFDHMGLDRNPKNHMDGIGTYKLSAFKKIFTDWHQALGSKGWNSLFLSNHDFPRMVSRFGNDQEYRIESAKSLATVLFTLRGTPYIYQGDEIGMVNYPFQNIEDFRDVQVLNAYKEALEEQQDMEKFLDSQRRFTRDHARTPMQWDESENAGFTGGKAWIGIHPNYLEVNVKKSRQDRDSVMNYYKKLINLRKQNLTLVYGDYEIFYEDSEQIYCYLRSMNEDKLLIINNISSHTADFELPKHLQESGKELLLSNYEVSVAQSIKTLVLRPYEVRIYRLQ